MAFAESWAAIIAAFASAGAAWYAGWQLIAAKRSLGAQTYLTLEEKFYEKLVGLRRSAAEELLRLPVIPNPDTYTPAVRSDLPAFESLADFFDFVGVLVRCGVVDDEMAWSSFYRRANAFWVAAWNRGCIANLRLNQPLRWNEFEYLVGRLEHVHRRELKKNEKALRRSLQGFARAMTASERDMVLESERGLHQTDSPVARRPIRKRHK